MKACLNLFFVQEAVDCICVKKLTNGFSEQRAKGNETWLSVASEDVQIQRLALAGAFVEKLRKEIYEVTTFRCSAGISFNKVFLSSILVPISLIF